MPIRKAGDAAQEALIDRLRNVADGAVLDAVERVLDAHEGASRKAAPAAFQTEPTDGGELLKLQDDDVDDVLRLLLGADDGRPL